MKYAVERGSGAKTYMKIQPVSTKLKATVNKIDDWAKNWRNKLKSTHVTFTVKSVRQWKLAVLRYPRKMK
jgi:hypothetical protein